MSLKILFTPSDNGLTGAFHSMVRLCILLRDNWGCDVLVLLRQSGKGEMLLKESNIPFVKIRSFNWNVPDHPTRVARKIALPVKYAIKPFAQFANQFAILRIRRLIRKEHVDIVHVNTTYIYVSAKAAYSCGVPVVWHLREFLEEDQNNRIWNKKYGYNLISKAAAIIAISKGVYSKYRTIFNNENLLMIYNGLDESYYASQPRDLFESKTIKILMVGTISRTKGQFQAIQAIKRLYDEGIKNIEFTIVGGLSKYALQLKKYVDSIGLSDYILFSGLQRDTAPYYHRSDIVLVCSRFEAFGRVTVEAMMGGCLVIGANTAGTAELINDKETGYLYRSSNIEDLKNKIEYVIDHPEEANLIAKRGQQYMLSNMTAEKNASEIYAVYTDILNNTRR